MSKVPEIIAIRSIKKLTDDLSSRAKLTLLKHIFDSLDKEPGTERNLLAKEEILKYAYRNRPRRHIKTAELFGHKDTGKGFNGSFDPDLLNGQEAENFPKGKYEFKRDYEVSKTGRLAIEISCSGKPSGLATTESDWWIIWLDGQEFRGEVGIIIKTERLKAIVKNYRVEDSGDDKRAICHIPFKEMLLYSNSDIGNWQSQLKAWLSRRARDRQVFTEVVAFDKFALYLKSLYEEKHTTVVDVKWFDKGGVNLWCERETEQEQDKSND